MIKIRLNSDEELVAAVKEGLKQRNGYCPCRLEDLPENKCMCKEFREPKIGLCHCGLYEKYEVEE